MIRTAIEFIKKELENYIVLRENDPDYPNGGVVDIRSIVLPDGKLNISDNFHIMITLAGVEEEQREGRMPVFVSVDDKEFTRLNPAVSVGLQLIFIAVSSDYPTALRDLSSVICFFQANAVFDKNRNPNLNDSVLDPIGKPWQLIERLSCKMKNLTMEQQNNVWSILGGKYLPSVIYTVSAVTAFETKGDKVRSILERNFKEKVIQ